MNPRKNNLFNLLCCPQCNNRLQQQKDYLSCQSCQSHFPIVAGTPILIYGAKVYDYQKIRNEENHGPISKHEYAPRSLVLINKYPDGLILDLGSGGKETQLDNVIQMDIFNFNHVDVVAKGELLPFLDNTFDAVISQAVFEHLRHPETVADEIERVLKPEGKVKIDTAFLQPLHAFPHHYYNASLVGLKHWFETFEIEWEGIEEYQQAWIMLDAILLHYQYGVPQKYRKAFDQATIPEILSCMKAFKQGKTVHNQALLNSLITISKETKKNLPAGVSILARKKTRTNIKTIDNKTNRKDNNVDKCLSLERKKRRSTEERLHKLQKERNEKNSYINGLEEQLAIKQQVVDRLNQELSITPVKLVWYIWVDLYLKISAFFRKK